MPPEKPSAKLRAYFDEGKISLEKVNTKVEEQFLERGQGIEAVRSILRIFMSVQMLVNIGQPMSVKEGGEADVENFREFIKLLNLRDQWFKDGTFHHIKAEGLTATQMRDKSKEMLTVERLFTMGIIDASKYEELAREIGFDVETGTDDLGHFYIRRKGLI